MSLSIHSISMMSKIKVIGPISHGFQDLTGLIIFCLKCTRTSLSQSQLHVGAEMNDESRLRRCDTSLVIPYSNRPSFLWMQKKLSITRSEVQKEREKGKLRNWLLSPQPEIELVKEIPFSDAELRRENINRAYSIIFE